MKMKRTCISLLIAYVVFFNQCTKAERKGSRESEAGVEDHVAAFIIQAADSRLMDIEQGKLARERGTRKEIREYGDKMIQDQTRLLKELQILAEKKNVKLPKSLSNRKSHGLNELRREEGRFFDKQFLRMMMSGHRRDLRQFQIAKEFNDTEVRNFALNSLPLIESHLTSIEQIKNGKADSGSLSESDGQEVD